MAKKKVTGGNQGDAIDPKKAQKARENLARMFDDPSMAIAPKKEEPASAQDRWADLFKPTVPPTTATPLASLWTKQELKDLQAIVDRLTPTKDRQRSGEFTSINPGENPNFDIYGKYKTLLDRVKQAVPNFSYTPNDPVEETYNPKGNITMSQDDWDVLKAYIAQQKSTGNPGSSSPPRPQ